MLRIRQAEENHDEAGGWFDARWHFSFDRYRDPEHIGVGAAMAGGGAAKRKGQRTRWCQVEESPR